MLKFSVSFSLQHAKLIDKFKCIGNFMYLLQRPCTLLSFFLLNVTSYLVRGEKIPCVYADVITGCILYHNVRMESFDGFAST